MKIAFKKGVMPWDWVIRIFSGGPFSHCELVFRDKVFFGAYPVTGVRYRRRTALSRWVFVDIPLTREQEEKIRAWCDTEYGCNYDWLGVFRFIIKTLRPSETRWFCSELCVKALQEVNILEDVIAHEAHPTNLYKLVQ